MPFQERAAVSMLLGILRETGCFFGRFSTYEPTERCIVAYRASKILRIRGYTSWLTQESRPWGRRGICAGCQLSIKRSRIRTTSDDTTGDQCNFRIRIGSEKDVGWCRSPSWSGFLVAGGWPRMGLGKVCPKAASGSVAALGGPKSVIFLFRQAL